MDETNGGGSGSGAELWGWWAFPAPVSGLVTTHLMAPLLGGTGDLHVLCEMKQGPYPGFSHQLLKPTTNELKQIQVRKGCEKIAFLSRTICWMMY